MRYSQEIIKRYFNSQSGFVLIAAIMAVMILIAVGFFALTVSTKDIRISARVLGERKAFSAAESGVNEICRTLNPNILVPISWTKVDPSNDPRAEYSVETPSRNEEYPSVPLPGTALELSYTAPVYDAQVTGRESSSPFTAKVTINVGVAYAPRPSDTQQGGN